MKDIYKGMYSVGKSNATVIFHLFFGKDKEEIKLSYSIAFVVCTGALN